MARRLVSPFSVLVKRIYTLVRNFNETFSRKHRSCRLFRSRSKRPESARTKKNHNISNPKVKLGRWTELWKNLSILWR